MPEGLILVVEDEPPVRRVLRTALNSHGFRVEEAPTATQGLRMLNSLLPDLVLLDLGLPDMDGLAFTSQVRRTSTVPILVISARGQEQDKILALDAGADDYLTKPFGTGELLARIRVALRHAQAGMDPEPLSRFTLDAWDVDFTSREVRVDGEPVRLTPNEFKLLSVLIRHAGKVLTHRQLLREVWEGQAGAQPHYLRVYMAQLRHKLEADPARPRHLITELGVGYRLKLG